MTSNRTLPRIAVVSATLLMASGVLSGCTSVAATSCAAPTAKLSSSKVKAGAEVTLTGENLIKQCKDTGGGPNTPATRITITLTFTDDTTSATRLAIVDADDQGRVETKLTIPANVGPGSAEIQVGDETAVPVTILTS